jgi:glycosyltransferase involved in cell wall biosynthesis
MSVPMSVPMSVMVHDLAFREVPEAFTARGRRWHEGALGRVLSRAAVIVTPSERSASLLRDAGAARLVVIAEGCDHLPVADVDGASDLLRALGVDGPYLLSVSTLEPRKNLVRLMEAYGLARGRLPEPWPLLVVGPTGWGPALHPAPGVKLTGMVSEPVLAGLYARARCLAYVPLLEGWGLPAVEAMASCTPVVASPMPSTGGAALEVDPLDVEAIADGLATAAGDERRRSELVTAGLVRAGELTWAEAARRHVEVWDAIRQETP